MRVLIKRVDQIIDKRPHLGRKKLMVRVHHINRADLRLTVSKYWLEPARRNTFRYDITR